MFKLIHNHLLNRAIKTKVDTRVSVMHSETSETNKFLRESLKDLKQSFLKQKVSLLLPVCSTKCEQSMPEVRNSGHLLESEEKKMFKKSIGSQSLDYEQRVRVSRLGISFILYCSHEREVRRKMPRNSLSMNIEVLMYV